MTQPVPFAASRHDLVNKPGPIRPPGAVGQLVNRILVHAGPQQFSAVLPYIDPDYGGLIVVAPDITETQRRARGDRLKRVADMGYSGLVLIDSAAAHRHIATRDRPFLLPEDPRHDGGLNAVLDDQRAAGADVALTPTGFICAGDTDALRSAAATATVASLDRTDMIFMVPIAVAMIGRAYFPQTSAILGEVPCPVALLLGGQFDPIDHAPKTVITSLRQLAMTLQHMAAFGTDLNAFDVAAHGGFAAAIGIGSSLRHVIQPGEHPRSSDPTDQSPSVLFPELATWRRGSTIAQWFGRRRSRTCCCAVCAVSDDRTLTRFLGHDHQDEARAHDVATWTPWARDLLTQPTVGDRAAYWRRFCDGAVREHKMLAEQLKQPTPFQVQDALKAWATLPAWPEQQPSHQS